jgi:hypothetical protein
MSKYTKKIKKLQIDILKLKIKLASNTDQKEYLKKKRNVLKKKSI